MQPEVRPARLRPAVSISLRAAKLVFLVMIWASCATIIVLDLRDYVALRASKTVAPKVHDLADVRSAAAIGSVNQTGGVTNTTLELGGGGVLYAQPRNFTEYVHDNVIGIQEQDAVDGDTLRLLNNGSAAVRVTECADCPDGFELFSGSDELFAPYMALHFRRHGAHWYEEAVDSSSPCEPSNITPTVLCMAGPNRNAKLSYDGCLWSCR
jgi:hypothetical protein